MKTRFIAEVSSNHNADLERCLSFVATAARIGCEAVKFQLFRIDQLFAPEILSRSAMHRKRKAWELPLEFLPHIADACRERGLEFCCTPFDLQAVDDLLPYADVFKIASYELTWPALLRACAKTDKPVILSTGMADMEECHRATRTLREAGCEDLTLLHCVSRYPTKAAEANLKAIESLRQACACKVGWSDHSVNPAVVLQAVFGMKAEVVEFHLDLEGEGEEFSAGHCWLPEQMASVIRMVREGESALGDGAKQAAPDETKERLWRADPEDGLRPFREIRAAFQGDSV